MFLVILFYLLAMPMPKISEGTPGGARARSAPPVLQGKRLVRQTATDAQLYTSLPRKVLPSSSLRCITWVENEGPVGTRVRCTAEPRAQKLMEVLQTPRAFASTYIYIQIYIYIYKLMLSSAVLGCVLANGASRQPPLGCGSQLRGHS
jgi:hypothetical protein